MRHLLLVETWRVDLVVYVYGGADIADEKVKAKQLWFV